MSECSSEQCNAMAKKVPKGYIAAHLWAVEMLKTHQQQKCPICGKWTLWVKLL